MFNRPAFSYVISFIIGVTLVFGASLAWAQEDILAQPLTPIARILNADGSLNTTGFTGSLDPSGYRMVTGKNGEPLFMAQDVQGAAVPGDGVWDDRFATPGIDSPVNAVAVGAAGEVYVGGSFWKINGRTFGYIARWDGTHWSPLTDGITSEPGVDSTVYAITVSGTDVYVGGQFSLAGGKAANRIARWDGRNWSPLPDSATGANGVTSTVYAIAVSGTNVYVGGSFSSAGGYTANRIARWNGGNNTWTALGGGVNSTVYAIGVSGTDVYVGGQFTLAGGSPANYIARWSGTSWFTLGTTPTDGVNSTVRAITVSGADVYVGGDFTLASGSSVNYVARWNGTNWGGLGELPSFVRGVNGPVKAIVVHGPYVDVGGSFTVAGTKSVGYIARYHTINFTWAALGGGVSGASNSVAALTWNGPDLYVGGSFNSAGGKPAFNIAQRTGTNWSSLGGSATSVGGTSSTIRAVAVKGSNVYVGGFFTSIGGVVANHIARWNGTSWFTLGTAPSDGVNSSVYAIAVKGSSVYVGGQFSFAGGSPANHIARWNGTSWFTLGTAPSDGVSNTVFAIAVKGSNVYAGGQFTSAGGSPVNHIARWNGTNWFTLGTGVASTVWAIAVSGTDVYVGGQFTSAGGSPANHIARWNGTSWFTLGTTPNDGVNSTVYAIAVKGSNVYVGGQFWQAGGVVSTTGFARWNGTSWSAVLDSVTGLGVSASIYDIAFSGTEIYVSGSLWQLNGLSGSGIGHWDGASWTGLVDSTTGVEGIWGTVYAIGVSGADIYAGGSFNSAGGKLSNNIAIWHGNQLDMVALADVNGNTFADVAVLSTDAATGKNWVYVKDGSTGNLIRKIGFLTGYTPVAMAVVPNVAGSSTAAEEIAVLAVNSATGAVKVQVKDAKNGAVVKTIAYATAYVYAPKFLTVVPSVGGTAASELAVLGVHNTTGVVRAQLKDASSGAQVGNVMFSTAYAPVDFKTVPGVAPKLAVLGVNGTNGKVLVQVRNAATDTLVRKIFYAPAYAPKALGVVRGGGGGIKLAVLGVNGTNGKVLVQVKKLIDGSLAKNVFFSPAYAPVALDVVPNYGGGSTVNELAVLGVNGTNGKVLVQVKDASTASLIKTVYFSKGFPPKALAVFADISGNGKPELGVLGAKAVFGGKQVQIKDGLAGSLVGTIPIP